MVVLASSSLSLVCTVVYEWYEFLGSFSFVVVKTSLGPNFLAMEIEFNGQILQTLNPNLMFSFFKDCCKALSTHFDKVILSSSKKLFFAMAASRSFLNVVLNGLKHVTSKGLESV